MSDEMQFDASLGGSQDLPERVSLMNFTSARANEIKTMKQALQASTGTKLAFQRLPKHMRRRVMSHNAKRLPRRLREIHLNQLKKSGMPPKQKRPSRKHRRRPRNLLDDYVRRQRTHKWLETHIWHAKRFHMIEKWGYKLADRPCDKAFRACYRATTKHCLVQDLSYFTCLEISGPVAILIDNFKTLCDCNVNLSLGAKAYIRGNREGQAVLFHPDDHIKKAIGTVYFHWKPAPTDAHVLWMWVHTAYYSETLDLLTKCFNLTLTDSAGAYINDTTKVQLTELNNLNRFRLTGPLSLAVLQNTLKPVNILNTNSTWFENFIKDSESLETFTKQCEYWGSIKNLCSSAELSPHLILSLIVTDPRFNLPKTKTKAELDWNTSASNADLPDGIAAGPLWDAQVRKSVKVNKISNAKLCQLRSQLLVPGTELEEANEAVPVMLIQRPGSRDKNVFGYNSGWDLIVPSGWGNTFWLSLIMWGGRAGGLREFNSVQFESGQSTFLAPDTQAGREEENRTTELYKHKFFSLPPNKRPNYTKLGIIEPFSFNWKILIHDWKPTKQSVDDFFVLRDKKTLMKIQEMLSNKRKSSPALDYDSDCIVPVRIKLQHKGMAKQFARIYLAEGKDLIHNNEPIEALKADKNQDTRKQMRDAHKNLLKRLRRKRIKAKQKEKAIPSNNLEVLKTYNEQMKRLWLPEIERNIRNSCSRQIMGFVTSGNFSFAQAHSCAVGYIAMGAVKTLIAKQQNKVLVRNISRWDNSPPPTCLQPRVSRQLNTELQILLNIHPIV